MTLYSGKGKRLRRAPRRGLPPLALGGIALLAGGVLLFLAALLWPEGGEPGGKTPPALESGGAESGGGAEPTGPLWSSPAPESPPEESSPEVSPPEEGEEAGGETFRLSFAGDCTLGTEHSTYGTAGSFVAVVGEDYGYPLAGVRDIFAGDDFTFVNLECALTRYNVPAEKTYRFRGPPEYAQILRTGGVEMVTLANNHSRDYGETGLADTRAALEGAGVAAGGEGETTLYTTQRGLTIGVYTASYPTRGSIQRGVERLQAAGAEVVVAAFHTGVERSYSPTEEQKTLFRWAVDCGAHVVYNSHAHVLQPMEEYGGGLILYSLGNFSFGGNRNPEDKDTAVVQVEVERDGSGGIRLKGTTVYPCRVSSTDRYNDYQPTLYPAGSAGAERVASKLAGTYTPPAPPEPSESPAEPELPEPSESPAEPESPEPSEGPAEPEPPEPSESPAEPESPAPSGSPTEPEPPAPSESPAEPEPPEPGESPAEPESPEPGESPAEPEPPEPSETPAEPVPPEGPEQEDPAAWGPPGLLRG